MQNIDRITTRQLLMIIHDRRMFLFSEIRRLRRYFCLGRKSGLPSQRHNAGGGGARGKEDETKMAATRFRHLYLFLYHLYTLMIQGYE